MGKHWWIAEVLMDMAAYAEKNDLHTLNAQLCNIMVTANQLMHEAPDQADGAATTDIILPRKRSGKKLNPATSI
ncbi:hypothetical protein DEA8626_03450 [Defluviimonas aquaemixtae]|uniref:Uncharacterized protein n=1 Tax=Albidovulum aquaemixtae TaxID=1542388 RepID=A0A2R8BLV6_9RHOB|nr:hypothetical protein [Defluviimonas aquaemixtae]SPH24398.1 hypothetical protein DEA8626_03450 [Defluviimonas aquaemixtae]